MSTEVLVKKDLILGGLTCAHCAEEIGKGVRKIDGIVDSNMNFVNKKLTVLFDSAYNEEEVIKAGRDVDCSIMGGAGRKTICFV